MPKLTNNQIIQLISAVRVLSAIPILINPLLGFILFVLIDYIDAYFLQHFAGMGWNSYQRWDKKFDIPGFVSMTYIGIVSGSPGFFILFFIYRMIGEFLFFKSNKQAILLFFPNFIEPYFVWVVLMRDIRIPMYWLAILFACQIFLEYYLHIFWPTYLRKNGFPKFFRIFGLTKVHNWS